MVHRMPRYLLGLLPSVAAWAAEVNGSGTDKVPVIVTASGQVSLAVEIALR